MAGSKGSKYYDIFLSYNVCLKDINKQEVISEECLKLISLINETGSLKSASIKLDISYRKAWGDLKKTEENLGFILVEKTRGGQHGGQSQLSENGLELLQAYNELRHDFDTSIKKVTKKFFNEINKQKNIK